MTIGSIPRPSWRYTNVKQRWLCGKQAPLSNGEAASECYQLLKGFFNSEPVSKAPVTSPLHIYSLSLPIHRLQSEIRYTVAASEEPCISHSIAKQLPKLIKWIEPEQRELGTVVGFDQ
ncbi:hypothetical protein MJO29_002458 [Puccinia striiformis f. sp. tritici]|nr:hypothetical protein MJO29_002458 [Puccinia striiformis f. sp. tritici]